MAADPDLIVEVNLAQPILSKIAMKVSTTPIYGLAASPGTCGSNLVYGLAKPFSTSYVLAIDIDNAREVETICELDSGYLDATSTGFDEQPVVTVDDVKYIYHCETDRLSSTLNILAHSAGGTALTYSLNGNENNTGTFTNITAGTYKLTVSSSNLCFYDTSFTVTRPYCDKSFSVPNAFTPNHDGKNDVLRPLGLVPIVHVNFSIYNRYGQKVFETKDIHHGWDGTFHGLDQEMGTYVWLLTYMNASGAMMTQNGTTALIR